VEASERLAGNSVPEPNTGCLLWLGTVNRKGYGRIGVNKKAYFTHRVAWECTFGPIPSDKWVLHKCDQPSCIRPDHLFLGTHADNMADMEQKGRARRGVYNAMKTHCPAGHPLSGDNLRTVERPTGTRRICIQCDRSHTRKHAAARTEVQRDAFNASRRAYCKAWRAKRAKK